MEKGCDLSWLHEATVSRHWSGDTRPLTLAALLPQELIVNDFFRPLNSL